MVKENWDLSIILMRLLLIDGLVKNNGLLQAHNTETQRYVQPKQPAEAPSPALQKDYTMVLFALFIHVWIYTYTHPEDIQVSSPKKLC